VNKAVAGNIQTSGNVSTRILKVRILLSGTISEKEKFGKEKQLHDRVEFSELKFKLTKKLFY